MITYAYWGLKRAKPPWNNNKYLEAKQLSSCGDNQQPVEEKQLQELVVTCNDW